MSENRNRLAAAAGAAVIAIGGGVAHFSGAFRSTADDIGRNVPRGPVDDVPVAPPPRDPPLPPAGGGEAATDDVIREGRTDGTAKDVICFGYQNFFEDGYFIAPSEVEFVNAVAEELAPTGSQLYIRLKADSLYEKLNDPETDLTDVATEIGCF